MAAGINSRSSRQRGAVNGSGSEQTIKAEKGREIALLVSELYLDMLDQTHLLIAGTTGSGKSVVLNNILQAHAAGREDGYLLLDPKRVELAPWASDFRCIAHATTPPAIRDALRTCAAVMDNRFYCMERNFQRKTDEPHIYVYIDELADLMSGTPETAEILTHLLRLGRAAGIHIIAATQDPSRKTLPASLTQNFTARLGLRCRSAIESRQIIGCAGCETLPEHGTGLYYTPKTLQPVAVSIEYQPDDALFSAIIPRNYYQIRVE